MTPAQIVSELRVSTNANENLRKFFNAHKERVREIVGSVAWKRVCREAILANEAEKARDSALTRTASMYAADSVVDRPLSITYFPTLPNGGPAPFRATYMQLRDRAVKALRNPDIYRYDTHAASTAEALYESWLRWLGGYDTEYEGLKQEAVNAYARRLRDQESAEARRAETQFEARMSAIKRARKSGQGARAKIDPERELLRGAFLAELQKISDGDPDATPAYGGVRLSLTADLPTVHAMRQTLVKAFTAAGGTLGDFDVLLRKNDIELIASTPNTRHGMDVGIYVVHHWGT